MHCNVISISRAPDHHNHLYTLQLLLYHKSSHFLALLVLLVPHFFTRLSFKPHFAKGQKSQIHIMDVDKIGLVLVRVSELRAKISNCIQKAASEGKRVTGENQEIGSERSPEDDEEDDYDEETQSLLNIGEALESLESQLSSLQALQQQQWYEREMGLADIRCNQKKLLEKLKDYKGEELEVIHEAIAFAGDTVEEDRSQLLLPPYPGRRLHAVVSDNDYLSQFPNPRKVAQNGNATKGHLDSEDQSRPESRKPFSRIKGLVGALAKAAITVVGVVAVVSLAGYEPRLRKRDNELKLLDLFHQQGNGKNGGLSIQCPPGKVPVVENGETRCLVKERVEIPFESVVATPDVNYGCG